MPFRSDVRATIAAHYCFALDVPCPWCGAAIGERCRKHASPSLVHDARERLANATRFFLDAAAIPGVSWSRSHIGGTD
jgi:hypothetical protein